MRRIELHEDNAGGLYLWDCQRHYGHVLPKREGSTSFVLICQAFADGEDSDWTTERIDVYPGCLVAIWETCDLEPSVLPMAGNAAREYLGLE
jgi:hypothetical protein